MAVTIATSANYWIAPNALSISLNALGEPNRIQCSVASGAAILVFIRGVKPAGTQPSETDPDADYSMNGEGLEYDNGHNYRRWPLVIWPSFFYTNTERYVYVAVPRSAAIGNEAMVVFPSQKLDIYGYTVEEEIVRNSRGQMIDADGNIVTDPDLAAREEVQGEQIGTDDYFYIWLQGIISDSGTQGTTARHWTANCESGYLDSDEAVSSLETEWYRWDPISQTVTFLKEIFMDEGSIFANLKASLANIMNLNVTGLLSAAMAKINDIKSDNYNAGLTDGTGFRLTNDDGEGNSLLEVDNLKVRKKATFMELEIREETYVGGNQTYSPAGSVIYRVEYMTENNEMLGYETMKVPFLLKRMAFLGGPFRLAFNYAARRRVRRGIKESEWPQVHHFRCYLMSDDGTTATRNWWRVGDQVKCQSFNKTTSDEKRKVNGNTGKWSNNQAILPEEQQLDGPDPSPAENTYFWRLVTKVGADMLDDGYVYDYIDLPYEDWYGYAGEDKGSIRDGSSDMPSAGDTVVCVGNRYDKARMNLVSINTYGADNNPPSIKGYRGVNKFKLTPANRVFMISPDLVQFRAKRFEFLNDDDEGFRVPLERGEWQQGVRYHYYDRVSWKGSIWLCIVRDDQKWIDVAEREYTEQQIPYIDYGEGSYKYDGSHTDHYYATGKQSEADENPSYYNVQVYTYLEPSDDNNAYWLCEVSKGTEITKVVTAYAATLSGTSHPADDLMGDDYDPQNPQTGFRGWKSVGMNQRTPDTHEAAIAATGIEDPHHRYGVYLWTRRTTYYRDANDPDREPTKEYSVSRWGIDADGIYRINSYYYALKTEIADMAVADHFLMPGDPGYDAAAADAKWFDTFADCAEANGGIGQMQGWYVWEKTVIIYDQHFDENGVEDTNPDVINYKSSRIGQDGQIGQEEYYCLRKWDTFEKAFPPAAVGLFPPIQNVGIAFANQNNPANENWRLSSTGNPICTEETKNKPPYAGVYIDGTTPLWAVDMPAYVNGSDLMFLWNFELRTDGMGTPYATKPVCIGNASRGIVGVVERYACSASGKAPSGRLFPADIYDQSAQHPYTDLNVWTDEIYDRAPSEALPYQWNWTRTLYSHPKSAATAATEPKDAATGMYYEDSYHVSAVRGSRGEDGAGVEYIYYCPESHDANGNPVTVTIPDVNNTRGEWAPGKDTSGNPVTADGSDTYVDNRDDWVPKGWTDNPRGVDVRHQIEYVAERKSYATTGSGGFTGGHKWQPFDPPRIWSKWGENGQDGDGTEYVFMRTKNDVAPTFGVNDLISGKSGSYTDQEWLPYINNKGTASGKANAESDRCTDDPKGTTAEWPYEWVAKRTMGNPAATGANQGHRDWKSYYECMDGHKMSKWSTYATLRLDIDNEMDMVATDSTGKVKEARTVKTKLHLYDGSTLMSIGLPTVTVRNAAGTVVSMAPTFSPASGNATERELSWSFAKGTQMSAAYEATIKYTYNNIDYVAVFTIQASLGNAVYQLRPTFSSLLCARNSSNTLDNPPALGLSVERIDGDSTKNISSLTSAGVFSDTDVNATLYAVYRTDRQPTSKSDGTNWPQNNSLQIQAADNIKNVYIALYNSSNVLLDRETVPVVRDGENGTSPYFSDIDNEMLSVACTYDGKAAAAFDKTVNVRMWHGSTEQTLTKLTATTPSGMTVMADKSGKTVRVQISKDASIADTSDITITIACNGSGDQTLHLYVNGVRPGKAGEDAVLYDLIPSASSAKRNKGGTVAPSSLTCDVQRIEGTSVSRATSSQGTLRYRKNGDITSSSDGTALTINSGSVSLAETDTYVVFAFFVGTKMVDKERVPVVYDGDDAVVFTIECADTIKPGDTSLAVSIMRSRGTDIQIKDWSGASTAWTLNLSASMSGGGSATVTSSGVTLSGTITKNSVLTLTLKSGSTTVATKIIRAVADGSQGNAGHVGRWFYYAGEWSASETYKFEPTRAPFVSRKGNFYMLDFMAHPSYVQSNNVYTSTNEDPDDSDYRDGDPWSAMNATFKYLITEATFSDFAHLGAFVFNGDWMISCNGTINGTAYNSPSWQNPATYNGAAAYTWFDPAHPNESVAGGHTVNGKSWQGYNFVPNFAIDGLTGTTYQRRGFIGGFDIGDTQLTNTNYNAGIQIRSSAGYQSKSVQIGAAATDPMTSKKAAMSAYVSDDGSDNGYNTALFLDARGAGAGNYAFHGFGNGVLNGYIMGFQVYSFSASGTNYLSLKNGMTQAIIDCTTNNDKNVYLPTLGDIRAALGIVGSGIGSINFCAQIVIINQTYVGSQSYNMDNIFVMGGTHDPKTTITSETARPRLLRVDQSVTKVDIPRANLGIFFITYIGQRFVANFIKG